MMLEKLGETRKSDKNAGSNEKKRPVLEAQVNDHPIRLAIDTGAEMLMVFSYAADRIGLGYQRPMGPLDPRPLKPGQVVAYPSELCRLRLGNHEGPVRLAIFETPPGLRTSAFDGVLGWRTISDNVWHIDWGRKIVETVPELPAAVAQWQRFEVYSPPELSVLALQVSGSSEPPQAVYIDTGDTGGVLVNSTLWKEILSRHPGLPTAIEGFYSPSVGCHILTLCWLPVLKVGGLELHDVPVAEAPPLFQQMPAFLARIGLYGLTRLEVVVDGKQSRVYVRVRQDYSKKYDYNRAGVAFLPVDDHSADLLATVLKGSPAEEAGLHDGDRLLRLDGRDVTGWRTDPNGLLGDDPIFAEPAGTKVRLMVIRDTQTMEVPIVLKELLPVEATRPAQTENPGNPSPTPKETP